MRRPLIVGNWKMHKTAGEAVAYVDRLRELLPGGTAEVVLAPSFTALSAVAQAIGTGPFFLAGQDLFWESAGAYTGEISALMLKDVGCRYVIVGHSERRRLFGETDQDVHKKVQAALRHGLLPIVCVGEGLKDREEGRNAIVVQEQCEGALAELSETEATRLAIAYEPVWAIGTGRAATPEQAEEMHSVIRTLLTDRYSKTVGTAARILYGGSVTAQNAAFFLASSEVDGLLVGGACLNADSFATIARSAEGASLH